MEKEVKESNSDFASIYDLKNGKPDPRSPPLDTNTCLANTHHIEPSEA